MVFVCCAPIIVDAYNFRHELAVHSSLVAVSTRKQNVTKTNDAKQHRSLAIIIIIIINNRNRASQSIKSSARPLGYSHQPRLNIFLIFVRRQLIWMRAR